MSAGYFDSVFGDAGAWERACDAIKARDSVQSPVTAPGAVTTDCDERPGDYLEERYASGGVVGPIEGFVIGEKPSPMNHPSVLKRFAELSDRYPPPAEAELVTLWKKDRRVVMSITAGGQTQDFYMPPQRLVYLIREVAEQLAENTLIQ